jgi:hypothetical protein
MRGLLLALLLAPALAFGQAAPYLKTTGGTMTGPLKQKSPLNALGQLARTSSTNNPRVNGVMASPPTLALATYWGISTAYTLGQKVATFTGSGATSVANFYVVTTAGTSAGSGSGPSGTGAGITDGTVVWSSWGPAGASTGANSHPSAQYSAPSSVNSYLWNSGTGLAVAGGPVNYYGGIVSNNIATGAMCLNGPVVAGAQTCGGGRWEFVTDSVYPVVRVFSASANSSFRVLVNGQYASLTPISTFPSGWQIFLLDFSASGGRALRTVTIEAQNNSYFVGVDVSSNEGVYSPGGPPQLAFVATGDSITAGAGTANFFDGYFPILCDRMGAQNCIDTGIGGTGYLASSTSGTALSRITDVTNAVAAYPNSVIIDGNGLNDTASGGAAIQAACLAYMQALRAAVGPNVPIFELGIIAASNGGTSWAAGLAAENAKAAAVAAMNDPLIFFIPSITAPGGSVFNGTSNDQAPTATGNSGIYINGLSLPHPNTLGHAFMAGQYANAIRAKILGIGGY